LVLGRDAEVDHGIAAHGRQRGVLPSAGQLVSGWVRRERVDLAREVDG
jgi:hypothetical protein